MALFVSFKKVRKFPAVLRKFRKLGATAFEKLVKNRASYSRVPPAGAAVSRMGGQIDVQSVTGVAALKNSGRK